MGVDPLTDGWSYFSDPDWTSHPSRFYRVQWGLRTLTQRDWPGFRRGPSPWAVRRRAGAMGREGPQTEVTISRGFWMGRHEVMQGDYLEVVGPTPVISGTGHYRFHHRLEMV